MCKSKDQLGKLYKGKESYESIICKILVQMRFFPQMQIGYFDKMHSNVSVLFVQ